jgi:hypothetical protein
MAREHNEENGYTECFIAYIDILGFKELVRLSMKSHSSLLALTQALSAVAALPSGTKATWPHQRKFSVQTRPFSDSMVIFMPREPGGLAQVLFMIRYLHDRMLELDLCIRGAVAMGGMYWNKDWSNPAACRPLTDNVGQVPNLGGNTHGLPITLGPGLIDAITWNLSAQFTLES